MVKDNFTEKQKYKRVVIMKKTNEIMITIVKRYNEVSYQCELQGVYYNMSEKEVDYEMYIYERGKKEELQLVIEDLMDILGKEIKYDIETTKVMIGGIRKEINYSVIRIIE